jgi:hypothetical protein
MVLRVDVVAAGARGGLPASPAHRVDRADARRAGS